VTLIVDDQDPGFTKFYPYYWNEENAGYNNHAWWTWTTSDPNHSLNWAQWVADIPYPGYYRVEVTHPYVITGYPDTTCARYQVYYSGGSTTITVDQSQNYYPQWTTLGTFYFDQGTATARVVLTDLTCDNTHDIWFDAVRWVSVP